METFDIEDIDFNEYNRRVYEEEYDDNYAINKLPKKIFKLNPLKRYEMEIKKYTEEYNKINPTKKVEKEYNGLSKKRKI